MNSPTETAFVMTSFLIFLLLWLLLLFVAETPLTIPPLELMTT